MKFEIQKWEFKITRENPTVSSMKSGLKWTINIKRKWKVLKSSFPKKSEIFCFMRQNLENHNLSLVYPKMEKFIPLQIRLKVLKVPRRHFSEIPTRKHSNFSSKLWIHEDKTEPVLVFSNVWKFGKIHKKWISLWNL